MEVKSTTAFATCFLVGLVILLPSSTAFPLASTGYQSDQSQLVYKMPRHLSTKFKVFAECRRECAGKCNHSLYAYLANKNECFGCLFECMSVFTEQAERMGINVETERGKKRARRLTEYSPTEEGNLQPMLPLKPSFLSRNSLRSKK
uniref:Uncharacterized protein n=1 Tax=Mesocestoides corti TaxID=53468 RepID=A0A5K3FC21_MESCO